MPSKLYRITNEEVYNIDLNSILNIQVIQSNDSNENNNWRKNLLEKIKINAQLVDSKYAVHSFSREVIYEDRF